MQRMVYSSSASIYGHLRKPDRGLIKEDDAVTIYLTADVIATAGEQMDLMKCAYLR
jgi:hypothetical protein